MLWAILDLFSHRPDFLLPCSLLYTYDEKFYKKSLNFYSKKLHGDSIKNESARTKRKQKAGGRGRQPVKG